MNYKAFEHMETGGFARLADEPEQAYMARVFREICRCDGVCGPDIPCGENGINDLLSPSLAACSAEEKNADADLSAPQLDAEPQRDAPWRHYDHHPGYGDGDAGTL